MEIEITNGIKISVLSRYSRDFSRPEHNHYFFTYTITIQNLGEYTVKLLRRHWHIFDSSGHKSQVEGEGVVGEQPEILPGEKYEYSSGCNLTTEMGTMHGTYLMQKQVNSELFEVVIPRFQLLTDYRLN